MTNENKMYVLLGALGYSNEYFLSTAKQLLENNDYNLEKILNSSRDLQFDKDTSTAYISLAYDYPTIKLKLSDIDYVITKIDKFEIDIEVE